MTRMTDMVGDLQAESSGWLFKSSLSGVGAYCGGPTTSCTAYTQSFIVNSSVSHFSLLLS